MCYGSRCMFEGYMGECTVHTLKFEEKYGYRACTVGRAIQCEDYEKFYEEHKEELDNIYRKYIEDSREIEDWLINEIQRQNKELVV